MVLSVLLQRFRLKPVPGMVVTPKESIVLSTVERLPMIICPPDRQFGEGLGGPLGSVRRMVDLPA